MKLTTAATAEKIFASLKAAARFPRRELLTVAEVARALPACEAQVIAFIAMGELEAVETASGQGQSRAASGRPRARFWRVPVAAWDAFIDRRRSDRRRHTAKGSKMPVVTPGGISTAPKPRKTPKSPQKASGSHRDTRKREKRRCRAVQPSCGAIANEARQASRLNARDKFSEPTLAGARASEEVSCG